jgi:gas vesicle protein
MKKTSNLLLGAGLAMAAGAILGMLYAPDKGERTRRRIVRNGRRLVDTVDDKISETQFDLEELKDKIDAKLDELKDKMQTMQ